MKDEDQNITDEYKIEDLEEQKFDNRKKTYKVIIIGNSSVGKSCISYRITKKQFDSRLPATISVDVSDYKVKVNDRVIQIQFWDSCGNDEFAKNTPNLFKNSCVAIIVYAINNRKSFEQISTWYNILSNFSFECIKYLVGNKTDLERVVEKNEAEAFKEKYNFQKYFETSAKTGSNIKELLENIIISLYEKYEKGTNENKRDVISLKKEELIKIGKKKDKGCCN